MSDGSWQEGVRIYLGRDRGTSVNDTSTSIEPAEAKLLQAHRRTPRISGLSRASTKKASTWRAAMTAEIRASVAGSRTMGED